MNFKNAAVENFDEVVAMRREMHANPEPSMGEFKTTEWVAGKLTEMGVPFKKLNPTGLIAEIKGGKPGKMVALRADMDALEIKTENTGLPFASTNGFMHACGHDAHTSMLLGAAKILNEVKDEIPGTVRLIFQAAEEVAKGALLAMEQGALEGVDMIFGTHVFPQIPVGTMWVGDGATMAAVDLFKIKVKGRGGHGAMPETTADALVAAAAIVMNLQTMISRDLSPSDTAVCTVGMLHSGSRFNIIAGEAELEGTCRSFSREVHNQLPGIMERIAKNTAAAFKCEAELEFTVLTEVLMNDAEATSYARAAAEKVADSPELVTSMVPSTGGEDFAYYTTDAKASFMGIGIGGNYPLHSDYFELDEEAMKSGTAWYAQVAYDFLTDNA